MDLASAIVLLLTAVTFGYFGGKEHGFHKLLNALGFDDNKEQKNGKKGKCTKNEKV